jgi:hypothetical protein
MSREIGLAGVELAPLAGAHNLAGIGDCGGPIEALAECVAHEGSWRRMVATYALVDVSNEFVTLGVGMLRCRTPDAVRLHSSPSITVKDLAFLAMRLASDRSEGSSPGSIQARYLARQSSARGSALFPWPRFVLTIPFE